MRVTADYRLNMPVFNAESYNPKVRGNITSAR